MSTNTIRPWPALWALVIGFFMILVDSTIVTVANPAIMNGLHADYNAVIWVTSAYLLTAAVPLLVTGRLGDRFGPKRIYLIGLTTFTVASLWCGLSNVMPGGGIGMLIAARAVQGFGCALMTPQTMAVITRVFPPDKRGPAMGLWGSVAGVATLFGPILGGFLVDSLSWEWIFFINVPVGIIGFCLAVRLVPSLPTHQHSFDIPGVLLSCIGVFMLVFGIQEGEQFDWGTVVGPITVWSLIIGGLVVIALFLVWQHINRKEPLLPLRLFTERNFSLANGGIAAVGFAITSMGIPLIFFLQRVRGLTPTQSALMMIPTAVISGVLSPIVGRLLTRINPRNIAVVGLVLTAASLAWYSQIISPTIAIGWILLPAALMGLANGCIWSPLSMTATRNLSPRDAGAGAGVYNTTRQIGGVLGSASIAALIESRLTADLPKGMGSAGGADGGGALPTFLHAGFTQAMSETLLLPAAVALLGAVVVAFFVKPKPQVWEQTVAVAEPAGAKV